MARTRRTKRGPPKRKLNGTSIAAVRPASVSTAQMPADEGVPTCSVSPWRNSTAKKLLHDNIVSRCTTQYSGPTEIYLSRPEYQQYKKENFTSNYYTLKNAIKTREDSAAANRLAFDHDNKIITNRRNQSQSFHYNNSDMQKKLQREIQQGLHENKTPREVRTTSSIYRNQQVTAQQFASFLSFERSRHQQRLNSTDYRERMQFLNAPINPDP